VILPLLRMLQLRLLPLMLLLLLLLGRTAQTFVQATPTLLGSSPRNLEVLAINILKVTACSRPWTTQAFMFAAPLLLFSAPGHTPMQKTG